MQGNRDKFFQLLEPAVAAQGCELLGVQLARGGPHTVLRVYIDRDQGVSLDDCERVSHQVSGVLDVENPIAGEYHLEVSSPGEDRPLFDRTHFERFLGHRIRVRMALPIEGQRQFTGWLLSVTDDDVVQLRDSEREWLLPLAQMSSARLVPGESAQKAS